MATVTYTIPQAPFFLQKKPGDGDPIAYSAADFRRYSSTFVGRPGILGSSHFAVTQDTNVGFRVIVNSGVAGLGTWGEYLVHLVDDQRLDLSGFTTNPSARRIHKVWVAVNDALTAGTGYYGSVIITEDTGTGAPTPPDTVATLQVATISISPNQANIQQTHIVNMATHAGSGPLVDLSAYLASGYISEPTLYGTAGFRATYLNGHVRLAGAVARANGTDFAAESSHNIGVMHARLRPKQTRFLTVPCVGDSGKNSTFTCQMFITPDGPIWVNMPKGQSPHRIFFDGVTYDLD